MPISHIFNVNIFRLMAMISHKTFAIQILQRYHVGFDQDITGLLARGTKVS